MTSKASTSPPRSACASCAVATASAPPLVVVQAKQGKWAEKREAYRARESDTFITKHADRMAARKAEVRIRAIDAMDEAITKFRSDMRATKTVRQPDGTIAEEPVMLIGPKDVALLIDRFQVLFDRPSVISEGRGINVTSESLPVEALQEFIERTPRAGRTSPAGVTDPATATPTRLSCGTSGGRTESQAGWSGTTSGTMSNSLYNVYKSRAHAPLRRSSRHRGRCSKCVRPRRSPISGKCGRETSRPDHSLSAGYSVRRSGVTGTGSPAVPCLVA